MHALSFVHFNMIHMTNWVLNGLPERFPKLKVIWIESGLAWVPFVMQRLDSEYMMRTPECPRLKPNQSEYIQDMYFTSQPLERSNMKLTQATFEAMRADSQLLYASDWPHWDFDAPSSITKLPFLDEQAKRNILGLSAARLGRHPVALRLGLAALGLRRPELDHQAAVPRRAGQAQHSGAERRAPGPTPSCSTPRSGRTGTSTPRARSPSCRSSTSRPSATFWG